MTIRELIVDWLTASRYVKWLESRHDEQRGDYERRLAEKRLEIVALKLEYERMRLVLLPFGSQAGADYAKKFGPSSERKPSEVLEFRGPIDWPGQLKQMLEEESNGVPSDGRKEVHQSATDDVAQPQHGG